MSIQKPARTQKSPNEETTDELEEAEELDESEEEQLCPASSHEEADEEAVSQRKNVTHPYPTPTRRSCARRRGGHST